MANDDKLEMDGTVTKVLPGTKFEVKLNDNEMTIICTMSGKLRVNNIKIIPGDVVTVTISPYDLTKGIIIWRHK